MRYKPNQKEQTRERILEAAGRSFRKGGYSGVGVDGLAKEAGVTSGAFYGHFDSKIAAFAATITAGMEQLKSAIEHFQQKHGDKWWPEFAKFYMSQKRTCDLAESCALQSLTPEVGRSDEAIKLLFETELAKIAELASGMPQANEQNKNTIARTWASLAMLIGGVTLARAVTDEKLSKEIGTAIQNAVISTQSAEADS